MKKKTLFYLNDFIEKRLYDEYVSKPFITLFKQYVDKELKNINDFVLVAKAYVKFIMLNKYKILLNSRHLTEDELECDLMEIMVAVDGLSGVDNIDRQNFVKMVEYFINSSTRVLDVGAGSVPVSSIKLARKNDNITAMDKFIVSNQFIRKFNVNPKNEYFAEDVDLSGYDFVAGLKPCKAIGQIVDVCKKNHKPYFLHLCNCDALDYGINKFKIFAGDWRFVLPHIDSDVKFVNMYATNFDISQEKFKKVVYKKCKFTKEMLSCGMIDFMSSFTEAMSSLAKGEDKEIQTDFGTVAVKAIDCHENKWLLSQEDYKMEK